MTVSSITAEQLVEARRVGPIDVIDVRTPVEFRAMHLREARNVPLDQLEGSIAADRDAEKPLYVICHSGGRSARACAQLEAAGVQNVVNIDGGTQACEAAGMPMLRGQRVISLERQVRIGAGLLVLAGIALGVQAHPAFLGLSAFVGAGLVFAGVTDTCGMGLLLARMPWNRAGADSAGSCETASQQSLTGA